MRFGKWERWDNGVGGGGGGRKGEFIMKDNEWMGWAPFTPFLILAEQRVEHYEIGFNLKGSPLTVTQCYSMGVTTSRTAESKKTTFRPLPKNISRKYVRKDILRQPSKQTNYAGAIDKYSKTSEVGSRKSRAMWKRITGQTWKVKVNTRG